MDIQSFYVMILTPLMRLLPTVTDDSLAVAAANEFYAGFEFPLKIVSIFVIWLILSRVFGRFNFRRRA